MIDGLEKGCRPGGGRLDYGKNDEASLSTPRQDGQSRQTKRRGERTGSARECLGLEGRTWEGWASGLAHCLAMHYGRLPRGVRGIQAPVLSGAPS